LRGFLIDTCAISEFTKQSPDLGLVAWLSQIDASILFVSAITIGELRYGITLQAEQKKRDFLERWFRSDVLVEFEGRILPFDGEVAEQWGRLRAKARKGGTPAPTIDAMIAATALHYNLAVMTRNESDFQRLGLEVVNPWKGAR